MKKEKDFGSGISEIYGVNEIIKLLNPINYLNWISQKDVKKEKVFLGYIFFLDTSLRSICDAILNNALLDMEEDYIYFRARHQGVEVNKLPNSCEKIILLKNLYTLTKKIKKAQNWESIKKIYYEVHENICDPINILIEEKAIFRKNISKEEIRKFCIGHWSLILFNQIRHGIPEGYWVSCFHNEANPKTYSESLLGYAYALELIWSKNYQKDFIEKRLFKMHNSKYWEMPFDEIRKKGIVLNDFFGIISDKIVMPLEKEYSFNVFSSDLISLKKTKTNSYFKKLLTHYKEPVLSQEEKLNYMTFWYNMEVLDSRLETFNGIALFLPLLSGIVERKIMLGIEEKSYVIRFKHPEDKIKGNDYSYGLLIQSYGSLFSDFSGWIIFDDCCGDYSGGSGYQHALAERAIKDYEKLNYLDVREIVIPKSNFKKYISKRVTPRNIDSNSKKLKESKDKIGNLKGIMFELFSYYYAQKHEKNDEVEWKTPTRLGDVDLEIKKFGERRLVECKVDPSTLDIAKEIRKLKKKAELLKTKNIEFWFWHNLSPYSKKILDKNKIKYRIIKEDLNRDASFKKDLDPISHILDKEEKPFPKEWE